MIFLLRLSRRLCRLWWWLSRPLTLGVRAIVLNESGQALLVRHTYMPGWHLPGGAVNKGESVLEAVKRELMEETGISCLEEPLILPGLYSGRVDFKHDHVAVFLVRKWIRTGKASHAVEIAEERFSGLENLPVETTPGTRRRLAEFEKAVSGRYVW